VGIAVVHRSGLGDDSRPAGSSALSDSRTARDCLMARSTRSIFASSRAIASRIDFSDVAIASEEAPWSFTA